MPTNARTDRELLLEILARIARLEQQVAAKSSAPLRVTRGKAAEMLGVSTRSVSRFAARGLLVPLPKATGQKTTYLARRTSRH